MEFEYYNSTHIVFGNGKIAELSRLVPVGKRIIPAVARNIILNRL